MSQLASVAGLVGTGLSVYATGRQASAQAALTKAQNAQYVAQQEALTQLASAQQAAQTRERQDTLNKTLASVRARASASGLDPNDGSAAAVSEGLQTDAAQDIAEDDSIRAARLAAGRRSLLNTDGSLTTWLRAGSTFANAAKSLLD
ncbi:hypothetical protein [Roseomonas elaeocarpi]|uniref:Uncharacterized protein n=1 Tax=Roseomonas elaeocarpi TaxID=907779 RepID=A0ABV6JRA4_9PROT